MTVEVPSNLIPSRVTQLPTAPVASADGLLLFTYEGVSYQIRAGDLLQVTGVPTTRQVLAGTGMTGGGSLASNVTLSIANGGVGTAQLAASGATPGSYGDAGNVPVVTIDATGRVMAVSTVPISVAGYVPTSRQVIAGNGLEGGGNLNSNVTLTADFEDSVPLTGTTGGSAGAQNELSRGDHRHPPVNLADANQIDGALPIDQGGTGSTLTAVPGAIAYGNGGQISLGSVGLAGQVLISGGTGAYTWGSALIQSDQPANVFFGGPASGGSAATAFRALVNADLPTSGVTANTYGSANLIPVLTINAEGVVTSATTTAFTSGLSFKGTWNATTNTPALASGTGTQGEYYITNVAGTTNLDGITDWQIGDWAVFNGTVWQKIDQSNTVISVNGEVGAVVLSAADVGATALNGTGATGTWAISVTGSAATATTATTATNVAGGAANRIVYNDGAGTSDFVVAPTVTDTFLKWNGSAFVWTTAVSSAVTSFSAGSTGLTPSGSTTGDVTLAGTLAAANGGTGLTAPGASGNFLTSNGTIWTTNSPFPLTTADLGDATVTTAKLASPIAPTISGGTVNNTVIGGSVQAAGSFTTVTATTGISGGTF